MKRKKLAEEVEWTIYNCHIHTFNQNHSPRYFFKFLFLDSYSGKIGFRKLVFFVLLSPFILTLVIITGLWKTKEERITMRENAAFKGGKKLLYRFLNFLKKLDPKPNDILGRYARFFETALYESQRAVFDKIKKQYPPGSVFVALPMDMEFMGLGNPKELINDQHEKLLALATSSKGQIIPFYAADPRRDDIVKRVKENLGKGKFQGIKIYPNLGYSPTDPKLMEIYKICEDGGFPVITHCSYGGIWKYKLSERERRTLSHPENYIRIIKKHPNLKFCLAHFGGSEEWAKHLRGETPHIGPDRAWVRVITDMIKEINPKTNERQYPNLFTDISYTIFTPRVPGLYIDLLDYLKVLLANPFIRESVLFGSDYYMVDQEEISEKEASVLLRSRLGEDVYKQIAHANPKRFLGVK